MSVAADQAAGIQLQVAGGWWQRGDQKRPELLQGKYLRGILPQDARQLLAGRQEGSLLLSRHPETGDRLSLTVHPGRKRGAGARAARVTQATAPLSPGSCQGCREQEVLAQRAGLWTALEEGAGSE